MCSCAEKVMTDSPAREGESRLSFCLSAFSVPCMTALICWKKQKEIRLPNVFAIAMFLKKAQLCCVPVRKYLVLFCVDHRCCLTDLMI